MSVVNIAGLSVSESSYRRARQIVESKPEGGKRTAESVLASIRQMKPGWTIETDSSNWCDGVRNLEISTSILERMAEDPEAMIRYKALILDLEELVPTLEEWAQNNEGKTLEFGITLDAEGTRAMAIVRTLMGGEMRSEFELPSDGSSWVDLIRQKINAMNEGQVENADGERSWLA